MYAQIGQLDMDDNMTEFNILPLAVYTRKQEKCQVFATVGSYDGHDGYKTCARNRKHDPGVEGVASQTCGQPHLAQSEDTLDCCVC